MDTVELTYTFEFDLEDCVEEMERIYGVTITKKQMRDLITESGKTMHSRLEDELETMLGYDMEAYAQK